MGSGEDAAASDTGAPSSVDSYESAVSNHGQSESSWRYLKSANGAHSPAIPSSAEQSNQSSEGTTVQAGAQQRSVRFAEPIVINGPTRGRTADRPVPAIPPVDGPANGTTNGHARPANLQSSRPAPRPVLRPRSGGHRRNASVTSLDAVTGASPVAAGSPSVPSPADEAIAAAHFEELAVDALVQRAVVIDRTPAARTARFTNAAEPWANLSILPDLPFADNRRDRYRERMLRGGKV